MVKKKTFPSYSPSASYRCSVTVTCPVRELQSGALSQLWRDGFASGRACKRAAKARAPSRRLWPRSPGMLWPRGAVQNTEVLSLMLHGPMLGNQREKKYTTTPAHARHVSSSSVRLTCPLTYIITHEQLAQDKTFPSM